MLALGLLALGFSTGIRAAASWDGNRWFQVEVSIFSHEAPTDADAERWLADRLSLQYPRRMQRFSSLADLFRVAALDPQPVTDSPSIVPPDWRQQRLLDTGPAAPQRLLEIRLPDPERDPFLLLSAAQSDFQQTNRALQRSSENRLLFHGVWRQPVLGAAQAPALLIEGGQRYDGKPELQGSLTIRFNPGQDRVVIDTNLWLIQFAREKTDPQQWPDLPAIPASLGGTTSPEESAMTSEQWQVNRIVQMVQSRDMRSNEFHYLDHPLLGLVVSVKPYDLPPPLSTGN